MATARGNRQKGLNYERELVEKGKQYGYRNTMRAWGSNGASLGEDPTVDVIWTDHPVFPDLKVQAKRVKALPAWLRDVLPGGHDLVVTRANNGMNVAILPLDTLIALLTLTYVQASKT